MKSIKSWHLLWPLALAVVGCNSPQGEPIHEIAATINATMGPLEPTIARGDSIDITFANFTDVERADLSRSNVLIPAADGMLRLPGIASLRASGRTPDELAATIAEAYEPVLGIAPAVSVTFASRVPRTFHVLGAVGAPGEFPVNVSERVTLVEALAQAGGVTYLTAYMGNVLLVRWDVHAERQVSWVIDARPRWWGEPETVLLQADDVVYVPDTTIANVNTWVERYMSRMIPFPRVFY